MAGGQHGPLAVTVKFVYNVTGSGVTGAGKALCRLLASTVGSSVECGGENENDPRREAGLDHGEGLLSSSVARACAAARISLWDLRRRASAVKAPSRASRSKATESVGEDAVSAAEVSSAGAASGLGVGQTRASLS
jgi:hypothetical protein